MKLLFWLWKNKADSSGLSPIYARITIKGKQAQFSTGIKISPHQWIATGNGYIKPGRRAGGSDQARLYNSRLSDIRAKIDDLYYDLERKGKPVTPLLLKNLFTGKDKPTYSILQVLKILLDEQEENPDLEFGTLKTYFTRANRLTEYLEHIKRKDMLCEEVDIRIGKDFFRYLKKEKKHSQNYAIKTLEILKKVMKKAVELQVIPGDPLAYFSLKKEKPKAIIALTEDELQLLASHRFASKKLQQVADLFVFQCCTGMAYAEIKQFKKNMIQKGIDQKNWIYIERDKVQGAFCAIPIIPRAGRILKKYDYELPVISNQKYNDYIKEVAEVVGIEKNLTTHVGRKTCGMLLLNMGVPIETVSRILGHANIRITQQSYAQVLNHKIALDMAGIDF